MNNGTRDFKIERGRSAVRVRFGITSMISDQNCATRSSITTLFSLRCRRAKPRLQRRLNFITPHFETAQFNRPNTGFYSVPIFIDLLM